MTQGNKWFQKSKSCLDKKMRLFCFHYAGGSAQIYFPWQAKLAPHVEVCAVQLPGRWDRLNETPYVRMTDLIQNLYDAIQSEIDFPYAFFGHSFGALIAFELYKKLRKHQKNLPVHLFLSSRWAPQIQKRDGPILHQLSDDDFLDLVAEKYSGIPKEILSDPEMREVFLRILRADFEVLETYEFFPEEKISTNMSVLGGKKDMEVPLADLDPWQETSCGNFEIKLFDGDHFYLKPYEDVLLHFIQDRLGMRSEIRSEAF